MTSRRQGDDKGRFLREKSREAVNLALARRWEEAVEVNRRILEVARGDVEPHNRLGKALMELGRYEEARDAFLQVLRLQPTNTIARKNLERLGRLQSAGPQVRCGSTLSASIFLEESGKACVARLHNLPSRQVLATVSAGDTVHLDPGRHAVYVLTASGERLGHLEARLGLRLARLLKGGNRYTAAVASASEREVLVVIRETYQHPDFANVVSFPARMTESSGGIPEDEPARLNEDAEEEEDSVVSSLVDDEESPDEDHDEEHSGDGEDGQVYYMDESEGGEEEDGEDVEMDTEEGTREFD